MKENDPLSSTVPVASNYSTYKDKQSRISIWVSTFISAAQNYIVILFANSSVSYHTDLHIAGKGFTV